MCFVKKELMIGPTQIAMDMAIKWNDFDNDTYGDNSYQQFRLNFAKSLDCLPRQLSKKAVQDLIQFSTTPNTIVMEMV